MPDVSKSKLIHREGSKGAKEAVTHHDLFASFAPSRLIPWLAFRSTLTPVRFGGILLLLTLGFVGRFASAEAPELPISPDGAVKISLFAAEPDIVTPIGATVDTQGRLLVIESNTHFRQKNYKGPPTDRILVFEDTKGAGKADKITTYFEGMKYLMNLAADRDGSVVVSSRKEIFRLVDKGDHREKISLATLETTADYPHNGLHGLAIAPDGSIYFGMGENLDAPWTLVAADGGKLTGQNGSGGIYHMSTNGSGLTRVAHGFWNPFGLGFDPAGTLWAVDNDPDGRPPCRLIDVAQGGDYGFEFRFGRTGLHPLQAWDAELPGTLGMVAGVGEAPCAVHWNRNVLLVSSWRDHEVQQYTLVPHGASYTATVKPLLTGGEHFRPVGIAIGADGAVYVTDWGSRSYQVNGLGRIWKLTFTSPAPPEDKLAPNEARQRAAKLRQSESTSDLLAALDDNDPAIEQAAEYGLSRLPQSEKIEWNALTTSRQRIGLLTALLERGANVDRFMSDALKDSDDRVRQMAVRAITEQGLKGSQEELSRMLQSQAMSPRLLGMTIAAVNLLNGDPNAKIDSSQINKVLLARMDASTSSDPMKAIALHMLQAGHPKLPLDQLRALLQSPETSLQLEAVRYLNADTDPARLALLAQVAGDAQRDVAVRAEAVVGLADDAAANADLLMRLATDSNAALSQEALRSLKPLATKLTPAQQDQLAPVAKRSPADADLVHRLLGQQPADRPPETDTAAWQKVLDQAPGNPDTGRRIFFSSAGPGCYRCHMIEGRGHVIGPDLTMIGRSQGPEHVLESILDPSKEVAPLFTLWTIMTKSGQRVDGMLLRRDGQSNEVYVDASGQETHVKEGDVVDRRMHPESLMPNGLVQALTDQELRDVVAFLIQKR